MNQNPLEGNKQEIKKNPEVAELCSSLVHHLGQFCLNSRLEGAFESFDHLKKAKEFIVKLLDISKNPLLISDLQQLQGKLDKINEETKFDMALINATDEIHDQIFNHLLEEY